MVEADLLPSPDGQHPDAYVVAKFVLGEAAAKKMWPHFQHFVEDVAHQLTTTTITRAPPMMYRML